MNEEKKEPRKQLVIQNEKTVSRIISVPVEMVHDFFKHMNEYFHDEKYANDCLDADAKANLIRIMPEPTNTYRESISGGYYPSLTVILSCQSDKEKDMMDKLKWFAERKNLAFTDLSVRE